MTESSAIVDLVGVGLNSLDTIIQLPHFPAPDSKLQVFSSRPSPGGQVASAVFACQRWGLSTRYIGKVGDDPAARLLREELDREGVDAHLIEVPSCRSQHAYILIDRTSGARTILWERDPRLDIAPSELLQDWITHARLLHLDGHPSAPAIAAARWAQKSGIPVIADLDNLYQEVDVLLESVDYLVASREFPRRLTGIADLPKALMAIARRFGCKLVGATLGRDGVLAWNGATFIHSPAFAVEVVDTTGAGDIFHAGFAYGLLQNWPLPRVLEFAAAAAALNCASVGARGGIAPVFEIDRMVRTGVRLAPAFDDDPSLLRLSGRTASEPSSSNS